MRELDVREAGQGPGAGRERRGPRRSAGPVRCAGATRADVSGAGARRAGAGPVAVGATGVGEVPGVGAGFGLGVRGAPVAVQASGIDVVAARRAPGGAGGAAAGAARRGPVGVARRRRVERAAPDVVVGAPPRSTGSLAEQACPVGPAPFPAVRAAVVRAVPAVGGARRGAGRPGSTGPAIVPPRTVRPATRRCVAPARRRSPRLRVRSAGERFLLGVATAVCAATAVVLLGLLGDAAAGWNSGPAEPVGTGAVVTGTVGR